MRASHFPRRCASPPLDPPSIASDDPILVQDESGRSLLHRVAVSNHQDAVQEIARSFSPYHVPAFFIRDNNGETPFHILLGRNPSQNVIPFIILDELIFSLAMKNFEDFTRRCVSDYDAFKEKSVLTAFKKQIWSELLLASERLQRPREIRVLFVEFLHHIIRPRLPKKERSADWAELDKARDALVHPITRSGGGPSGVLGSLFREQARLDALADELAQLVVPEGTQQSHSAHQGGSPVPMLPQLVEPVDLSGSGDDSESDDEPEQGARRLGGLSGRSRSVSFCFNGWPALSDGMLPQPKTGVHSSISDSGMITPPSGSATSSGASLPAGDLSNGVGSEKEEGGDRSNSDTGMDYTP